MYYITSVIVAYYCPEAIADKAEEEFLLPATGFPNLPCL